jgi:dihydrofolate reductase
MGKITVFEFVTVNGFFAGPKGEIDWFKEIPRDGKFDAYTQKGASSGNTLLFGRTTYEMMKSYWPTPEAAKADPKMAKVMRESPKIVISRKLESVAEEPRWKNVTVMRKIDKAAIRKLKKKKSDLTILGSGSIVQQLTELGLIDQYDLATVPILLGAGKPLFKDLEQTSLKLLEALSFKNGIAVLRYEPA